MNPYTDRRYGGYLSATQGFMQSYMQYQKMRWDMRQAEIANQYKESLMADRSSVAENRALDREYKEARNAFIARDPDAYFKKRDVNVSVFTPGQTENLEEKAERAIEGVKGRRDRQSALEAYDSYRRSLGLDYAGTGKQDMGDFYFEQAAAQRGFDWPPEDPNEPEKTFQVPPYKAPNKYWEGLKGGLHGFFVGAPKEMYRSVFGAPSEGRKLPESDETLDASEKLMWRRWKLPREVDGRIQAYLNAGYSYEQVWDAVKDIPADDKLTVGELDEIMQEKGLYGEGTIIVNPKTGERKKRVGDKWLPIQ